MATAVISSTPQIGTPSTHQGPADLTPSSDQILSSILSESSHTLLQPPPSIHTAALVLAKRYIDPVAALVSASQAQRLRNARRKRKRGAEEDDDAGSVLRMKQVHLEGFAIDQIWEQAKRILDASRKEVQRSIADIPRETHARHTPQLERVTNGIPKNAKVVHFDDEGFEVDSDSQDNATDVRSESQELEEDIENETVEGQDFDDENDSEEHLDNGVAEDGVVDADGMEGIERDESDMNIDDEVEEGSSSVFVKDRHGLNDGFFSIDDFNKNSEFLERQDATGDPDDGAASDEEEVDWDADPLAQAMPKLDEVLKADHNEYDPLGEEDGPTFGNAGLNAPFDTSDEDEDDGNEQLSMDHAATNTNDIHYADFFAPPARAKNKSSTRHRALPKTQPPSTTSAAPIDAEIQRAISSVHRDIFSDTLSNPSSSDLEADPNGPAPTNLSTHERRRAALASQIRSLEAAAVAKREWTLSGEALASARPLNSLLEEDLDFERTGKPVPVVTAAVSASIEDMIKERILARNFDEVRRRRPGADLFSSGINGGKQARRGLLELDDRKNEQSLAEIYETEHLRRTDPAFVDKRDEKLKAAHASIGKLWADVSAKLDALSSWHYRPKPPTVEVSVVSDAPKVRMEDARPAGVGVGEGDEGGLAPQEIYKVGQDGEGNREEGVVVTNGGGVVGMEELTREQKLRKRRRVKERGKKRGDRGVGTKSSVGAGAPGENKDKGRKTKAQEKQDVVGELKRAGVKVIGKGGELQDVEGNKVKAASSSRAKATGFKL